MKLVTIPMDRMDVMAYGKAARRKLGPLPDNFHICSAVWLGGFGDKSNLWETMKVTGAQFNGSKRIPDTSKSVIVTREEMAAETSEA